jgi:hypothetical protein
MRAGLLSLQQDIMPSAQSVRHYPLRPDLRYLLVKSEGREALMVWVGKEQTNLCEASVWVSADGVVMRLCGGRLVGVSERQRQWQLVDESMLSVAQPSSSDRSIHRQTSDEQPGFHLGVARTIEKIHLTTHEQPTSWFVMPQTVQWVEERDHLSGDQLSFYAVNTDHDWIAGQRCITAQWCVQWQTWPSKSTASIL